MLTIQINTFGGVAIISDIPIGGVDVIVIFISCNKLLVHPTKRVHCSIFIHTDNGSVKCPHAPPPYIFCRFTSWTKGFRMTPFSRVTSFSSGVLGSRRLAIVDDLGLPLGVLSRYESISPGHSKPFVDFNTATSLWSNCGFVFT